MHYTTIVIRDSKISDYVCWVYIKIVFHACLYVIPVDCHIVVSVSCTLLVIKTQCMQQLVFNCPQSEAPSSRCAGFEIQLLAPSLTSNVRPTARNFSSYVEVVRVGHWVILPQTDGRLRVILVNSQLDLVFLSSSENIVYDIRHYSVRPATRRIDQSVPYLFVSQHDVTFELATPLPRTLHGRDIE